jgi:hypothetical protein
MNSSAVSLEMELTKPNKRFAHRREKTEDPVIEEEVKYEDVHNVEKDRRRKYLKKMSGISSITMCEEEKYMTEKDSSFRRESSNDFSMNPNFQSDPSFFYSEAYKMKNGRGIFDNDKETDE